MTDEESSNVTGADGELVDRLRQTLERLGERDTDWLKTALLVITVELGVVPMPEDDRFSSSESLARLRNRIADLTRQNVRESFLVLGVREAISAFFRALADNADVANRNREEVRLQVIELYDDPERLRAYIKRTDPGAPQASWSDEQLRRERDELMRFFDPLEVENMTNLWGMATYWSDLTSDLLSDAVIGDWRRRRLLSGP